MNKLTFILLFLLVSNLAIIVESKKKSSKPAEAIVVDQQSVLPSLPQIEFTKEQVHWYLKVAFFFITGVAVGIYFEAKVSLKNIFRPLVQVTLYGFLIAVVIYSLFTINTFLHIL